MRRPRGAHTHYPLFANERLTHADAEWDWTAGRTAPIGFSPRGPMSATHPCNRCSSRIGSWGRRGLVNLPVEISSSARETCNARGDRVWVVAKLTKGISTRREGKPAVSSS
eukprot:5998045-Pleurochrysis_carterae.AAC.2